MPTQYHKNYAIVMLLIAATVAADDNEDEIARCARISSVGDRILCLEDALRESSHAGETTVAADAVVEDSPTPNSGASAAPPLVTVGRADVAEEVAETAGQSAPPDVVSPPQAEETVAAAVDAVTTLGSAEAQKQPDPLDSVNVVVVSVDSNAYGKLIFTTESGQVWRQTDQSARRYRQIPFDAEIRKGASGSYFIRPLTGGVSVRVRRSR